MRLTPDQIKALPTPEVNLIACGHCPKCERKVVGYVTPFGSFAPEIWATLREHGIDPATGHKQNCEWRTWEP